MCAATGSVLSTQRILEADGDLVLAAHVQRGHARRSVEIAIESLGEPPRTAW